MDVRRIVTQLTRGRKVWIWVSVVVLIAFTVSSALSQPASKSKEPRPALQTQPLPATEPAGEEPVFKAYQSPEADVEAAAKKLQAQFAGTSGVRVAADERTGKLLIVAPPEVHRQLAGRLTATEVGETPTSRPASPRVQKTLALKNTKSRDFEVALTKLVGRQLPATTQRNGQVVDYTIVSRGGNRVIMSVDRQSSQVTFDGPADLVAGWVRVAGALDARPNSKTDDSRVVPFSNSNAVASGAVQKALSIFGQQVSQTRSETTGRLVSMQLQPREGARANQPNANQPDAKQDEQKDDQQPGVQPPVQPQVPPPADVADPDDLGGGLIGPVQIEFLEALDQIIIRGHPRDVARVQEIIEEIERLSLETVPVIEVYNLQHVDSEAMALFVNNVYTTILSARQGAVSITALVKPNALLLIGRDESVRTVVDLIKRLDQPAPVEAQFQIFKLRHTSATEAETTIREFLGVAQPGAAGGAAAQPAAGLGTRGLVIGDFRTNSLIVRASPRDLAEIQELILKIDVNASGKVNELRVFTLRNSLAEELAPVLQSVISGQVQQQRQGQQQGGGGGGGQQFQQFQQGQGQGQGQGQQGRGQGLQQAISTMLQFQTIDREGRRSVRSSGILTDVRITADPVGNSLLVSAPPESMEMLAALIAELDQIPTSTAQIKVFEIINGDAQSLMTMLQQLFGLQQTGAAGARQGAGAFFPQFITPGTEEGGLVSLRFSVDARTNSIIASGSAGDMAVVEAILLRLDESDVRQRKSIVYRLKNAPADALATSLTQYLTSQRQVQQAFTQQLAISPLEQIEREVVVVPELVSNSLIISATPRYFEEIRAIVEQLDARPPMVGIQVLIAEVTLNNTDEFGIELGLQDSVLFDRSLLDAIQFITTTTTNTNQTTTETQQVLTATNNPGFNFNSFQPLGNSGSSQSLATASSLGGQGLSSFALGRQNNELGFGGLVLSASSENVSFLLRALSESRRLDVLARPQVTTLENQPAYIQVGQRVPYITSVTPIVGGGVQNNVAFENVGLILLVQPRVSPDGLVVMDIRAERSEVGPEAEGIPIFVGIAGDVIRSPRINSTIAETTVSAANGQTIVLGGLLTKAKSETHRRVPLLADIPILGHLFRYDNVQSRRTELLIIMTPRVLRTREDSELFKQIEASRMSWCLADVIKMHGESGLRGRHAEWTDAETTVVYPDMTPEMIQSLRSRSTEEIGTPQPTPAPPQDPLRLAPPSSPPPSQPGGSTPMRLPLEAPPRADPPPTLPPGQPQSGTRSPSIRPVAAPVVNGPTITPQQAGAAPRPVNQPAIQPAQNAAYYSPRPGQAPANGMQQPAQGAPRQALFQLPAR